MVLLAVGGCVGVNDRKIPEVCSAGLADINPLYIREPCNSQKDHIGQRTVPARQQRLSAPPVKDRFTMVLATATCSCQGTTFNGSNLAL